MKINDCPGKIKVVFNPNIIASMGQEKLDYEGNNVICPKVENFRKTSKKDIPTVKIFDSDEVPEGSLYILNDDLIYKEKPLTTDDLNDFGNVVFGELQILFNLEY